MDDTPKEVSTHHHDTRIPNGYFSEEKRWASVGRHLGVTWASMD
jgi:hypothetical protein